MDLRKSMTGCGADVSAGAAVPPPWNVDNGGRRMKYSRGGRSSAITCPPRSYQSLHRCIQHAWLPPDRMHRSEVQGLGLLLEVHVPRSSCRPEVAFLRWEVIHESLQ